MKFYKLESMGNDFIVIYNQKLLQSEIAHLCQQHFSIGADGIIIFSDSKTHDLNMQIYNKDGSLARMCGNGLKIAAYFLLNILHQKKNEYEILVNNTTLANVGFSDNQYYAMLEMPHFIKRINDYYFYNIGNNHVIKIVDYLSKSSLISDANKEEYRGFNVTNLEIIDHKKVKILTYENGVGITYSCGSASLCAFLHLYNLNLINEKVEFYSLGGNYHIEKLQDKLCLFGNVKCIYKGETIDGN